MYRWIYTILIIIAVLISTLEVSQPFETLSGKDSITPVKPLSMLKSTAKIPLPSATANRSYAYQIKAEGKKPDFCKLFSGTLPPGLKLSRTGRISGTPSKSGTFLFNIRITDNKKLPPIM